VVDLARTTMRRITFDSGSVAPFWSPDGRRVAYSSKPAGRRFGFEIRWTTPDSAAAPELLLARAFDQFPAAITPDGQTLVFERKTNASGRDIWILPLQEKRTPRPYLETPANEYAPALSLHGRWLAFVSDESGRDEVYVASFPRAGVPVQISLDGGGRPRWASSRELVYQGRDGIAAVVFDTSLPMLQVSSRRSLFVGDPDVVAREGEPYDVHPDGSRFVVIRNAPKAGDVLVLLNWFNELRAGGG
jgi:dipeptidyl aminopeptidase/acylaminoacyl peptidase